LTLMSAPTIGQAIPDFTAQTTDETPLVLSALRGRPIAIYFYPKDSTPGCTQEGQDFNALLPQFQALDCEILGVSRDSLKSHLNFRCKQNFSFHLISDPDETLCSLFDVIRMKNMYGKQVRGIERSTFLIDANGILIAEWRKLSVKGHAQNVLETLRAHLDQPPG
jgi:thioredoxin-dependent peroxiredoxin